MDIIRMFISAANDRSERTLGAMYIVTVMTLVNSECREMYPWLYESASPGIYSRYQAFNVEGPDHVLNLIMNQINQFHPNIFMQPFVPLLNLPAPAIGAVPAPEELALALIGTAAEEEEQEQPNNNTQ
jgi:hypothetical protein